MTHIANPSVATLIKTIHTHIQSGDDEAAILTISGNTLDDVYSFLTKMAKEFQLLDGGPLTSCLTTPMSIDAECNMSVQVGKKITTVIVHGRVYVFSHANGENVYAGILGL